MFKKLICITRLVLTSFTFMVFGGESDFINYDWLMNGLENPAYTDHIPHFRRLFNTIKVRGFLECGCGYSTKYFIDHCDKVVSIEFITKGTNADWMNHCCALYKDCSNWVPLFYNSNHANKSFEKACGYACATHKDYALLDASYLYSLDQYFKNQLDISQQEGNDIDVAFVDAGVFIRGDMVKILLANRVPIVIAHDTESDLGSDAKEGLYQWFVVKTPSDYEKIYIPFGKGTTFWIHKDLDYVIESISDYRNLLIEAAKNGQLSSEDKKNIADQF